ncbi:MAG: hypothetical protein Q4E24_10635 [bacterium]|nr:hypothetical protein [bacterium]
MRKEREMGAFFSGWLEARRRDGNCTPEEYVISDYLSIYGENTENGKQDAEKEREIRDRIEAWKASETAFLEEISDAKYRPELQSWQAYEMLENVISELDLNVREEYEFLANVKKMLYDTLLPVLGTHYTKEIRAEVENTYQREWEKAQSGVDRIDVQKLFAETASFMQYVGVTYEEETQIVLSEIAMGKESLFKRQQGQADWDIRLFTNYLVSEMVLSDEKGQYTEDEKQILVRQVLPVYTAALSENNGEDAHTSQRMAQAQQYLFKLLPSGKFRLIAGLAVVIVAVQAVISLAMTAVVGVVVFEGLKAVWDLCKKVWEKKTTIEKTPLTDFLQKKVQEMEMQQMEMQEIEAREREAEGIEENRWNKVNGPEWECEQDREAAFEEEKERNRKVEEEEKV